MVVPHWGFALHSLPPIFFFEEFKDSDQFLHQQLKTSGSRFVRNMAAVPAHVNQLSRVNEYFTRRALPFSSFNRHLEHCSITYPDLSPEAQLAAWSILPALATLDSYALLWAKSIQILFRYSVEKTGVN